jgi:hypothetical protein
MRESGSPGASQAATPAPGRAPPRHVSPRTDLHSPIDPAALAAALKGQHLQVALDVTELGAAADLALMSAANGADLVEVGDPLIKRLGRDQRDLRPGCRGGRSASSRRARGRTVERAPPQGGVVVGRPDLVDLGGGECRGNGALAQARLCQSAHRQARVRSLAHVRPQRNGPRSCGLRAAAESSTRSRRPLVGSARKVMTTSGSPGVHLHTSLRLVV